MVGVQLVHGIQHLRHLPGLGLEPVQQAEFHIGELLGGGEADGGDVVGLVRPVGVVGVEVLGGVVGMDGGQRGIRQADPAQAGFQPAPEVAVGVTLFLHDGVGTRLFKQRRDLAGKAGGGVDPGLGILDPQDIVPGRLGGFGGGGGFEGRSGFHGNGGLDGGSGFDGKGGFDGGSGLRRCAAAGGQQQTERRKDPYDAFHRHSPFSDFIIYDRSGVVI